MLRTLSSAAFLAALLSSSIQNGSSFVFAPTKNVQQYQKKVNRNVVVTRRPFSSSLSIVSARTAKKKNEEEAGGQEKGKSNKPEMDPSKRAALDGVLQQIERNYGRGSVVRLGDADSMNVDSISSGSLTL
eukprot:3304797-Ditylum_brightwellii.AAC.1